MGTRRPLMVTMATVRVSVIFFCCNDKSEVWVGGRRCETQNELVSCIQPHSDTQ